MKISDIVVHLMEYLPRNSDSFSDYDIPDSVTVVGGVATVVSPGHKRHDNDYVCVTHSRIRNNVDGYSVVDGILYCEMEDIHGFTTGWQTHALLKSDSDDSINGEYEIDSVVGNIIGLKSAPDTLPGDTYISELRDVSINGIYKISNVTASGYTFTIPWAVSHTVDIDTVRLHHSLRITGAASIDRYMKSYEKTEEDKLWLVVTRGRNSVSKSETARTDFSNEQTGSTSWEVYMSTPFTLHVVAPVYDLSGRRELDAIENERPLIYKSILGHKFDTGFSCVTAGGVAPDDDSPIQYDKTRMIVPFNFYQLPQLTNDDTAFTQKTSAFNALDVDFLNTQPDNDDVIMSLSVIFNDGE